MVTYARPSEKKIKVTKNTSSLVPSVIRESMKKLLSSALLDEGPVKGMERFILKQYNRSLDYRRLLLDSAREKEMEQAMDKILKGYDEGEGLGFSQGEITAINSVATNETDPATTGKTSERLLQEIKAKQREIKKLLEKK